MFISSSFPKQNEANGVIIDGSYTHKWMDRTNLACGAVPDD